jgi:hypothetical protein
VNHAQAGQIRPGISFSPEGCARGIDQGLFLARGTPHSGRDLR